MARAMGRRRPRLLLRFGAISAAAVLVLGLFLAQRVRSPGAEGALRAPPPLAAATGRPALRPPPAPADLRRPLDSARSARLTRLVDGSLAETGIRRVKLWNDAGLVV